MKYKNICLMCFCEGKYKGNGLYRAKEKKYNIESIKDMKLMHSSDMNYPIFLLYFHSLYLKYRFYEIFLIHILL